MKKQLLAVLFGSALVLGACGGGGDEGAGDATENGGENQTDEQTGDNGDTGNNGDGGGESASVNAEQAKKYFQQTCAGCHGADLSGNNGPNLQNVGSKYSKEEILNIIKQGKGSMPGNMAKGEKAETIAAWLSTKK